MPYYIVQAGTGLYKVGTDGTSTTLTLPTGVTIDSTKRGRFAVLGRNIVMVNSPSKALWIDDTDTVRLMNLDAPVTAPELSAGSSTGLTGAYRVRISFCTFDADGNLMNESAMSPISAASASLSNQSLLLTGVLTSDNSSVNGRRVYRTVAGGSGEIVFLDTEILDNTTTQIELSMSDASLQLTPADDFLGSAPANLKLITEWNGRLWAVSKDNPDVLYFSADGVFYGWKVTNQITIPPEGYDDVGISGFAPRREELAVLKQDSIHRIIGISEEDFQRVVVSKEAGCVAPDSVIVYHDIARWLGKGYVFEYGGEGVRPISREKAHGWFNTDTYFNRSRFDQAFAKIDPLLESYELHIAAVGSSNEDRWVQYMIGPATWFGPHLTSAFTPSFAALLEDSNDLSMPVICGTDGQIYKMNQSTMRDGASTAIDFDVDSKYHHMKAPEIEKLWGNLLMVTKVESAGTLSVTPKTGGLDASAQSALSHDLTLGRERLAILGNGRFCQLRFRHNTVNQGVTVYGYEIPNFELGRR